jgi:transglutaminase-like putative cysteine protease
MIYSVRHITKLRYKPAVRESVMELRMQPRSEANQRCLSFDVSLKPTAAVLQYRDFLGNAVHHFDIAGTHGELIVRALSLVEVLPRGSPHTTGAGDWQELEATLALGDYWDMLEPSIFARPTHLLRGLARELKLERRGTPLEALHSISKAIHNNFAYVPNSTKVDSPIDHALGTRTGVCQDFAHIMIALVRDFGIPCRYVSGYLFIAKDDRSLTSEGASHAWVEALVPGIGWMGFDPTNDLECGERHIRVAVGRDYADVPPTRGVYKGGGESELSVSVSVALADSATPEEVAPAIVLRRVPAPSHETQGAAQEQQQQ